MHHTRYDRSCVLLVSQTGNVIYVIIRCQCSEVRRQHCYVVDSCQSTLERWWCACRGFACITKLHDTRQSVDLLWCAAMAALCWTWQFHTDQRFRMCPESTGDVIKKCCSFNAKVICYGQFSMLCGSGNGMLPVVVEAANSACTRMLCAAARNCRLNDAVLYGAL